MERWWLAGSSARAPQRCKGLLPGLRYTEFPQCIWRRNKALTSLSAAVGVRAMTAVRGAAGYELRGRRQHGQRRRLIGL